MDEFWNNPIFQYLTILFIFAPLVVALLVWKKIKQKLSGKILNSFNKLCHELLVQYSLALGAPILYTVIQTWAGTQDLTSNLTNAYLTATALTGLASLWNIYKTRRDIAAASRQPNNRARMIMLRNVEEKNLKHYYPALIAAVLGTLGLIFYNILPGMPRWSWFVAFLTTAPAAFGLIWSTAATTVAANYQSTPSLGRKTRR